MALFGSFRDRPELGKEAGTSFVKALYRGLLHREASNAEVAQWIAALCAKDRSRRMTAQAVLEHFLSSQERQAMLSNTASATEVRLFVPPGHFYSPIVDPRTVPIGSAHAAPETLPGIDLNLATMLAAWTDLLPHLRACPFSDTPTGDLRYGFDNGAYSYGDGSTLYAMIRRHRPKRIIEVGCGWSSACMLDAIDVELTGICEVTFIEPYPELLQSLSAGRPFTQRVLPTPVQAVDLSEFERLDAGDILFIDSTHVLKTASDVNYELIEILPRLKSGVLIHFHDIFWPFEYPDYWIWDNNRSWNEIYALRIFLADNPKWRIKFFGHYLSLMAEETVARDFPTMLKNPGGSIWLERL